MPIVTIHANTPIKAEKVPVLLEKLQIASAEALGTTAENVWIHFHEVRPGRYKQNADPSTNTTIVYAKANAGRSREAKHRFATTIINHLAEGLGVAPEAVWFQYEEVNPENVWSSTTSHTKKGEVT